MNVCKKDSEGRPDGLYVFITDSHRETHACRLHIKPPVCRNWNEDTEKFQVKKMSKHNNNMYATEEHNTVNKLKVTHAHTHAHAQSSFSHCSQDPTGEEFSFHKQILVDLMRCRAERVCLVVM